MSKTTLARRLSAVASALILTSVALATPAQAATGTGLDGTDPAVTGCATGSYPIWSTNLYASGFGTYQGYMEVRYSPRCGTNWIRVYNAYAQDGKVWKAISRPAQGTLPSYSQYEVDWGTGWSWGMQVYAPGATHITVQAGITTDPWIARSGIVTL